MGWFKIRQSKSQGWNSFSEKNMSFSPLPQPTNNNKNHKPLKAITQGNKQGKQHTIVIWIGSGKPEGEGTHCNSPERNKILSQDGAVGVEIKGKVGTVTREGQLTHS